MEEIAAIYDEDDECSCKFWENKVQTELRRTIIIHPFRSLRGWLTEQKITKAFPEY
jgi:hypothetical protein